MDGGVAEGWISLPLFIVVGVPVALVGAIAALYHRMNKLVDENTDRMQQDLDDQRRLALEEAARARRR